VEKSSKIFVSGSQGLAGSAIARVLRDRGYASLLLPTHHELDLTNQAEVNEYLAKTQPEYIFHAAGKVGGIMANSLYPAEYMYQNLMMAVNLIHSAYQNGVKKLLFLGSSCIYPKLCPQPIREDYLLTGALEPTNEAYALAKIAGIKLIQHYRSQYGCDFISAMPTNLYGINDHFHPQNSHVLPALIRKLHLAKCLMINDIAGLRKDLEADHQLTSQEDVLKALEDFGIRKTHEKVELTLWGSGAPYREFLYVDDLAEAVVFLMQNYSGASPVNIGTGKDITIKDLAMLIKDIVGFEGKLSWDTSKPDGTPRKLLDISLLSSLGFSAQTKLKVGIAKTYAWYKNR